MRGTILITLILVFVFGCAPTHFVKPLDKKQSAVNVSLGGPLIKYNELTIPIPFVTTTYGYGIDSSLTGFASANVTSALYGNLQMDIGATKLLTRQVGIFPAISISPLLNVIYRNKETKKLYPQLDINSYWECGRNKNLVYVGIDNWFELSKKKAYEMKQKNHWFFSPMIGYTLVRNRYCINIEAKVIAPNKSNEKLVVEYQTPFNNSGAFGVYVGYTRKF
jgi:hypothetical protein